MRSRMPIQVCGVVELYRVVVQGRVGAAVAIKFVPRSWGREVATWSYTLCHAVAVAMQSSGYGTA